MSDKITIVIPARNEADTVASVITKVIGFSSVAEVIVVDNASTDATAFCARSAGARVVHETKPGMGNALKAGYLAAQTDWTLKIDADLEVFDPNLIDALAAARAPGVGLIKGLWQDPKDDMPMTRLLVRPAIRLIAPGLSHIVGPNSGIFLFDRTCIDLNALVGGTAADLDVMLRMHDAGHEVAEIEVGEIRHDPRNTGHYDAMAETILSHFLTYHAEINEGHDSPPVARAL